MKSVCNVKLDKFFPERSENENVNDYVFNCEMTFQFALAWFLKKQLGNKIKNIEFEKNVYGNIYEEDRKEEDNRRCDIVVNYKNGKKALMELKYVVEGLGKVKTSCDSRRSFMKDLCRLKFDPLVKDIDEKYCIFISNMSAVLNNYTEKEKEKINDKFLLFFDKNLKKNSGKWFSTNWNLDNKKTREKCKYKPMILVIDVNNETQITKQQWAELLPMYKNQIDKK